MKKKIYRQKIDRWYLERAIFLIAGIFVLTAAILALKGIFEAIYFIAFVGILLIVFAFSGYCPMAMLLHKLGLREK